MRGETGQASIELVAAIPLCAAVALGAGQLLAAGAAHEAAGAAAQAAAMAMLQGGDPPKAARAAAPGWSRSRMRVHIDGRKVSVRVTPPPLLPGTASLVATTAHADAGPR